MKKIVIITRAFKLNEIKEALARLGVQGMTVSEVQGFGHQAGHQAGQGEAAHGMESQMDYVVKFSVEVVVEDALAPTVIAAASAAARTGRVGDGKILVQSVAQAVRIRTGETGDAAISM